MLFSVAAAALLVFAPGVGAAQAATSPLQLGIDEILAAYPGGTQVGEREISWDGGEVILTLEPEFTTFAVGNCATGSFCAYTGANRSGTKVSFTNCSATNSTSVLGKPVRSVANARSSGSVRAYNGSSTVLTVAAGGTSNTTSTVTRLGC